MVALVGWGETAAMRGELHVPRQTFETSLRRVTPSKNVNKKKPKEAQTTNLCYGIKTVLGLDFSLLTFPRFRGNDQRETKEFHATTLQGS